MDVMLMKPPEDASLSQTASIVGRLKSAVRESETQLKRKKVGQPITSPKGRGNPPVDRDELWYP
jgi:hypothetical protein